MKKNMTLSRRGFLKGAAVAGGALAGTRLTGAHLIGDAHAQVAGAKGALVVIYLDGGYNALFPSAGSFQAAGTFGVNANNVLDLGNNLRVDRPTFDRLPAFAKTHMATIGVAHGISDHGNAQRHNWVMNNRSYALSLAAAMGGDSALKHAHLGNGSISDGFTPAAESGVSFQRISDMRTTLDAVAGSTDAKVANRYTAAFGLASAESMSAAKLGDKARTLTSLKEAYPAGIATLQKPVKVFDRNEFNTAYALNGNTTVNSFASKMAAAELMVRYGTNVITIRDGGWDSHGDRDGANVRGKLGPMMGPLSTFINRLMDPAAQGDTARNIAVLIMGDFSRSLPGSDHQSNMSATVIGNKIKVGSTGNVNANVGLPGGGPRADKMWAFLAKVMGVTHPLAAASADHDILML